MGGNGKAGEKWGDVGGEYGEIAGTAHGMWVVEGRGGMWLREIWDKNGRKTGQNTHFSQPPFPPNLRESGDASEGCIDPPPSRRSRRPAHSNGN